MIFRTQDGDFVEINKDDFSKKSDYFTAIMGVFGIKPQMVGITRDDINQLDLIYNIAMSNSVRQSRL
jgi:hypothetical protein